MHYVFQVCRAAQVCKAQWRQGLGADDKECTLCHGRTGGYCCCLWPKWWVQLCFQPVFYLVQKKSQVLMFYIMLNNIIFTQTSSSILSDFILSPLFLTVSSWPTWPPSSPPRTCFTGRSFLRISPSCTLRDLTDGWSYILAIVTLETTLAGGRQTVSANDALNGKSHIWRGGNMSHCVSVSLRSHK